jgi:Flp pilus assembly protein TadG
MKSLRNSRQRGSAVVEMALVFLPLMFGVFSIFELGRAMWTYHTLATAVKKGTRTAMVHGARCADASASCPVTVGTLVQTIQQNGVGLDMSVLQLTFTAGGQNLTCAPANTCSTNATNWPPAPYNPVGQTVTINGKYGFNTILKSMWPGQTSGTFNLAAKSTETIQF